MREARFFRGILSADATESSAKGPRVGQVLARGVRAIEDVPIMQQRGLASLPKAGDSLGLMQVDDLVVATASESTNRPSLEAGETVLYATEDVFIKLSPDGSVLMQSGPTTKITISPDGTIQLEGRKIDAKALEVELGAGVLGPTDGVVTGKCLCVFTGAYHPVVSKTVRATP